MITSPDAVPQGVFADAYRIAAMHSGLDPAEATPLIDAIARSIMAATEPLQDKIDGLEADLDSAVEVAWNHGASEWVKINYPLYFARFTAADAPLSHGAIA